MRARAPPDEEDGYVRSSSAAPEVDVAPARLGFVARGRRCTPGGSIRQDAPREKRSVVRAGEASPTRQPVRARSLATTWRRLGGTWPAARGSLESHARRDRQANEA